MKLILRIFPDQGFQEEKEFASYKELFEYVSDKAQQEFGEKEMIDNLVATHIEAELDANIATLSTETLVSGESEVVFPRKGFIKRLLG